MFGRGEITGGYKTHASGARRFTHTWAVPIHAPDVKLEQVWPGSFCYTAVLVCGTPKTRQTRKVLVFRGS